MKSLAELGSEADTLRRDLQLLRTKLANHEEAARKLAGEIAEKLEALKSVEDRATAAFEAIREGKSQASETPPEAKRDVWGDEVNVNLDALAKVLHQSRPSTEQVQF